MSKRLSLTGEIELLGKGIMPFDSIEDMEASGSCSGDCERCGKVCGDNQ